MSHSDNSLNTALTTKRVFTHDTTLFGLPTSVFILGVALMLGGRLAGHPNQSPVPTHRAQLRQ